MPNILETLERVALRALSAGERELLRYFSDAGALKKDYKAHHEIVTVADRAANQAIISVFRESTPDFDILSEEGAPETKKRPASKPCWRWIVDPLDGTTNFVAQLPLWGISIALEHEGEIVLGVISHPMLGTRYIARKNGGAYRLDVATRRTTQLRVSDNRELKEALGFHCYGYKLEDQKRALRIEPRLSSRVRAVRRLGVAAVEAVWVAQGLADYALLIGVKPWDVAAGALLVREAGGRVLTPRGKEWTIKDSDILFVSAALEKKVLALCKAR